MEPIRPTAVSPPANVLLVQRSCTSTDACRTLRRHEDTTAELRVTFASDEPSYPAPETASDSADGPTRVGVISVGDVLRSGETEAGPDFSAPLAVDAVSDPTDLSAIGVSVSQFCERWGATEQLAVCFHSLDALLRNTEPERVFEFTYYLNKRLSSVGAVAHFHLDPSLHEQRVVTAFGDIFDDVIVADDCTATDEASDEDVARQFGDADGSPFDGTGGRREEATDEEVARLLG